MDTIEINRGLLEYFMQCNKKYELKEQSIRLNSEEKKYFVRGSIVHKIVSSCFRYGERPDESFGPTELYPLSRQLSDITDDTLIQDLMYKFVRKYEHKFIPKQNEKHIYPEVLCKWRTTMRNTELIFKSTIDSIVMNFNEKDVSSEINEYKTISSDKHVDNEFYIKMNFQMRCYVGILFHLGLNPRKINYYTIKFPKTRMPADVNELFNCAEILLDRDYVQECADWLKSALTQFLYHKLDKRDSIKNFSNCFSFYGMPCQYTTLCMQSNVSIDDMVKTGFYVKDSEKHDGAMFEYNPVYRVFERINNEASSRS